LTKSHSSRPLVAPGLLFLFLLGSEIGAAAVPAGEQRFPCRIDRVDGTPVTGGFLAVTGWAADPAGVPVKKIELVLDGVQPGEAEIGGYRPDVLQHFARPDYLWSGWTGTLDLAHARPGSHSVSAIAVSRRGDGVDCGTRDVQVAAASRLPEGGTWRAGVRLLFRTAVLLCGFFLIGWAPAAYLKCRPVLLSAPLLGLSLTGVAIEIGSLLRVRPLVAAAALTFLSAAGLFALFFRRPAAIRLSASASLPTIAGIAVFSLLGVIPFAAHGEGAVLGDIDDGIRECAAADAISMWGWRIPPEMRGYLAWAAAAMKGIDVRPGGFYLLSFLSELFRTRAYDVHAATMLAIGALVVCGAGLLSYRVSREFRGSRWLAPGFTAINGTLLATLYGQHLGSLLAAALFAAFVFFAVRLVESNDRYSVVPVAVTAAAGFTYYPESMAAWVIAGLLSLFLAGTAAGRRRTLQRYAIAAGLAILLNPVGFSRATRFLWKIPTASRELSSPYNRLIAGDTHYFPSVTVVPGLAAYRLDAPAPVGMVREVLIPVTSVLIVVVCFLGWRRLTGKQRVILVTLGAPIALALFLNYRLGFPYGYAKFLPMAVPVWAMVFALLARAALASPGGVGDRRRRAIVSVTVSLTVLLTIPATLHVLRHARRAVPSYDPAFRELPALARTVDRNSVIEIDEPLVARREWMRYFLGECETRPVATTADSHPDQPGRPRYLLLDRRRSDQVSKIAGPAGRDFALAPVASNLGPVR
jgi:hypothetical protein